MRTVAITVFVFLFSGAAYALEEYKCERIYFSNTRLVDNELAAELMPEELIVTFDYSLLSAYTSATGSDYPLVISKNRATYKFNSPVKGDRLELNFRQLKSKGQITWGSTHSDDGYQKSPPARYQCEKIVN